jgi:4-hydroxy-tetrahydrodipicolinate synthase
VIDMNVETMARLFELKNICGVKDATGKIDRVSLQRHAMGPDFVQLSGDDSTALAVMAHGGHGCISVTANVAPKLLSEFQASCLAGDYARALTCQDRLMPLHAALFLEPNPSGIKYAMSVIGKMSDEVRLPLVKVSAPTQGKIRAAMIHAGLIN